MKLNKSAFNKRRLALATRRALRTPLYSMSALALASAMVCAPAVAQQAGGIKGKVVGEQGAAVAGVTVTATSNVMPKPRTATTSEDGSYNLPLLLPGVYELTFADEQGNVRKATVEVLLDQTSSINVALAPTADSTEVITITGSALVRQGNSALTNSLGEEAIKGLPVGQSYRDLFKLVPGVQYSENSVLGPSAGGSGVDNKYGFDGVDVSLPLFGNLASEPSNHDIANVSIERGGAKAIGFNRSGGFAINTTSKSGTNEFHGSVEYKLQNKNFVSDIKDGTTYETDKSWTTASLSGPLIEDQLFFYASYYRPEETRENKETAYGPTKNYKSVRDEYFGKLTWAPIDDVLFNVSYRTSDREDEGVSIGQYESDSVSNGEKSNQDIFTFDGSWLIDDYTTLTFSYGTFELEGGNQPDNLLSVVPQVDGSLDLNNLEGMGYFNVPVLKADDGYDRIVGQALIDKYGYIEDGSRQGGGGIGAYSSITTNNFYRDSFELALDHEMFIGDATHSLHLGFKWAESQELLRRTSNGWGSISYIGGLETASDGTPIYYRSRTQQAGFISDGEGIQDINSYVESFNIEINDSIELGDFTYNLGVLISKDIYYGQGLREKDGTVSGFEVAPGNKYKMYTIDWKDMIQPRMGVTWRYDGENSLFANFAQYNPEASSQARAASWDRNTQRELNVSFDADGNYIESAGRPGSSGKAFVEDMTPRRIDEYTIGTNYTLNDEWLLRGHIRHRKGSHFWEDVWNYARSREGDYGPNGGVPQHIRDRGDYIANLADIRAEIGGSSYVVAEVDDGFTKYWEASVEAEYHGDNVYLNASYVWSHYYGNFDQDNTTATTDANTFIGSSNYNDDVGQYSWDNKYGTLSGDKPHLLKVFGYYTTDWNANIGAYLLYQSGQPWEKWDATYYGLESTAGDTNRYAEPAGSRRSPSHWQLDLNYTQDYQLTDDFVLKFRADLFNVFDRQTGYNFNPYANSATFGEARSYYNPRRLQVSVAVEF